MGKPSRGVSMMRKAFAFAASLTWAIEQRWLETILRIANREGEGVEAVEAQLGRKLDNSQATTVRDGVAVVPVIGPVFRRANLFTEVSGATSIEILARDFAAALADPSVKAIMLNVDSPGGEVSGVNEFAQMVRAARGTKPIVAYVGGLGCSAAYWIASAADKIVADATAMVGSIGVVQAVPNPDADAAADIEIVSSQSPKKRPDVTKESGRAVIQERVDEIADVFVRTVAANRGTTTAKVLEDYGRGAALVGASALAAGMIDALGSYESTLAMLSGGDDEDEDDDEDDDRPPGRRTEDYTMKREAIAKRLGLPETATDAEIDKALEERDALLAALGTTNPAEAVGKIHGLAMAAKAAEGALERIARLEADAREREVASILEANRERVTPANRAKVLGFCGANAEGKGADPVKLRAMVELLPKDVVLDGKGHEPPPPASPSAVAEAPTAIPQPGKKSSTLLYGEPDVNHPEMRKVMRLTGMTPSRIKAAWEKRVARAADMAE